VCWERFCHRIRAILNSGLFSFVLVRTVRSSCIASSHWTKKLNNKLKVAISPVSKIKPESESFTIPFYGDPLNSASGCVKTAVTAAVVTENVRMSRRWKAESVAYGICKQLSSSFVHLRLLKPDRSPVCTVCPEGFQHLVLTSKSHNYQTVHRNTPYE
jgi:hypothetical protein